MLSRISAVLSVTVFLASCYNNAGNRGDHIVETSIGKIILLNDKVWSYQGDLYKTGDFSVSVLIEDEYKTRISKLPVESRVEFFWSVLMHISLDASYKEDLFYLIRDDCGSEVISRIDSFLRRSKELKVYGPDQKKFESYKLLLENI